MKTLEQIKNKINDSGMHLSEYQGKTDDSRKNYLENQRLKIDHAAMQEALESLSEDHTDECKFLDSPDIEGCECHVDSIKDTLNNLKWVGN